MKLFARMPDPLYVGGKKTRAISDPAFSALLTFYIPKNALDKKTPI